MEAAPAVTEPKPRRWPKRLLKALLWTSGSLVLLWVCTFAFATWELNRAIAALKARGEPTTFAEAMDGVRRSAESTTGAEKLLEALREDALQGSPGNALSMLPGGFDGPITPADHPKFVALLQLADRIFALLDEVAALPPGPIMPTSAADALETNLSFLPLQDSRGFIRLLASDIRFSAQSGDARRTVKRLAMLYRLSERLGADQFIVPRLIGLAGISIANAATRSILENIDFADAELVEMDQLLREVEGDFLFLPALVNQRAMEASIVDNRSALIEQLRTNAHNRRSNTPTTKQELVFRLEQGWAEIVASPLGAPIRRRAAARLLSIPDDVLQLADTPPPWPTELHAKFDAWKASMEVDRVSLNADGRSYLDAVAKAGLRIRRQLAMTRLALRLKRHFQKHHRLPDRLEEVCDAAMPSLPTKWYECRPFVYSVMGNAFRIEAAAELSRDIVAGRADLETTWGFLMALDFTPPKKAAP